jgi:uncharacterized protein (DUF58 family)
MTVLIAVAAILLLVWLQNQLYARFWNRGLGISLGFSQPRAFEGAALELTEVLSNASPLPLPWVAVKFRLARDLVFNDNRNAQISDDYYRNDMFSLLMFQKITRRLPFVCARRGYYRVKSVDLVSGNLLLTRKLIAHAQCAATLTVYPKPIPPAAFALPYRQLTGELLARRFIQPDPFEFRGIREYLPQDSFKAINFKATARAGTWMVNVHSHTASQTVVAALNLQPYSAWGGDTLFEQAIRLAAAWAARCVAEGIPFRLLSNGRDVVTGREVHIPGGSGPEHLHTVYEALARVDLTRPVQPMAPWLAERVPEEEALVLISPYHQEDLARVFEGIRARAFALWMIPAFRDTLVKVPQGEFIRKWEVAENEQGPLFF